MSEQWSQFAANEIAHAAMMAKAAVESAVGYWMQPSVLYRPTLSIDGDQWCALYGDDLQTGVAGFGDSPEQAMWDFDKNWSAKLPSKDVT